MICTINIKAMPLSGIIKKKRVTFKKETIKSNKRYQKLDHTSTPKRREKEQINTQKPHLSNQLL